MDMLGYVIVGGLILALSAASGFVGYLIGACVGSELEQKNAANAGAGRWVVDHRTGERSFEYGREG